MLTLEEVADGAADLELDEDGVPLSPLALLDLSRPTTPAVAAAAEARLRRTARAVVGACPQDVADELRGVAEATACVLTVRSTQPWAVPSADVDATATQMSALAERSPRATAVLVPLLRLTGTVAVADGLVAESFAYSMLLAGPEFAAWRAATPVRGRAESPDEPVLVRREGDLLTVTLHRPERRNAYSRDMRDALVEALSVGVADGSLHVVVDGAGPAFCSGGDLDEFGTTRDVTLAHHVRLARSAGLLLHQLGDRVEVRVHGACVGAGTELPAFASKVVARPDAVFRLPELSMGLVPGAGGTVSVTRRIGRWRTAWLVLSGASLDAQTALSWGLVDVVA